MLSSIPQLLQTAVQHHQAGRLQQAEALYRKILATDPANADALNLLGVLATQIGRFDDAFRLIRTALSLQPDHATASYNLANAFLAKGQIEDAIPAYQQFLVNNPNHFPAHCNLGVAFLKKDRFDDAIASFQKAIALNPNLAEAHFSLGGAFRKKGDLDHALISYQYALALMPKYPDQPDPKAIRKSVTDDDAPPVLAFRSDFAQVLNVIGGVYKERLDLDNAIASYKNALRINPHFALAHNNLGFVLRDLGQFDEAAEHFRMALSIDPRASFYKGLTLTGWKMATDADMDRLIALLNQPRLSVDDRIDAEFALAKSLDEKERFDDAFEHLATANRLFKQMYAAAGEKFDGNKLRESVDRAIQNFTPSFFSPRHSWGNPSELPVFIVGMPRSGTTLVEQIAASHPAVFGAGELAEIGELAAAKSGDQGQAQGLVSKGEAPANGDSGWIAKASMEYLEHLRSLNGTALRITDKMPGNVFHLGLIALLFPNARVIFCQRNAMDNCLSCFFERFVKNHLLYTYDLADCGQQYVETQRLTQHWLKTLPLRMLEVQYETMVSDQEVQSRRLIDFLGLPWDPACLEFHRTKRPVLTASAWQVRQPMYARSAGRWRNYERHLEPLLKVFDGRN